MCRLFGFRSVIPSQVHRSLIAADNALCRRSEEHADGWGVAFYVEGTPHLTRSTQTAQEDQLFHRVSGVVSSETVVAHVRKATQGSVSILNCHPFQHGRWVFAHNGDVRNFVEHRARLVAEIAPRLRRYILGETDSEVLFFLFLTHLARHDVLTTRFEIEPILDAVRATIALVRDTCDGPDPSQRSLLTFLATDGASLIATHGGKELRWSTHKTRCPDRDTCPSLSPECEAPTRSGFVNHLILSSEPLSGENIWNEMSPGDVVGVDWRMRLTRARLDRKDLPQLATPPP
jgi:glutamine amidotransferase